MLAVVPGATGFGIGTPAGRRGAVIRVTTLADSGAGSLRAALQATGARVVVFDVAGTIELTDNITIAQPYLTLAGQTAPSPGITLAGAGLVVATHDVLIQHLRVRVGARPSSVPAELRDGIRVASGSRRVVVDHASVSWAVDENASTAGGNVSDVTFRHCIFSEGLSRSIHPKGEHSRGFLVFPGTQNLALIGNLFAHNYTRSPGVGGSSSVLIANNLVYDPGLWGAGFWDVREAPTGPTTAVLAGNHFVAGPSTQPGAAIRVYRTISSGSRISLRDNRVASPSGELLWVQIGTSSFDGAPPQRFEVSIAPVNDVWERVLTGAGARPTDRDAVDLRIVSEVRRGQGRIIDSPEQVGGWPALTPATRRLPLPPRHNSDDDRDGYTNLEEWLHALAAALEG